MLPEDRQFAELLLGLLVIEVVQYGCFNDLIEGGNATYDLLEVLLALVAVSEAVEQKSLFLVVGLSVLGEKQLELLSALGATG